MTAIIRRATIVALALGAVACTSSPSKSTIRRHNGLISDAHRALRTNSDDRAIEYARLVENEATSEELRNQAGYVIAEALMQSDRLDEAADRIRALRSELGGGPQVDELDGKLAMLRGEYATAVIRFQAAEAGYESPEAKMRARDLERYALGIEAYISGRINDSEKHWNKIEDVVFFDEVKKAVEGIASNGSRREAF